MGIPSLCLLGLVGLIVHRRVLPKEEDTETLEFLVNITMPLVPVVLVKWTILKASDRLGLLNFFALKVLIMHMSLFIIRSATTMFVTFAGYSRAALIVDICMLVGVCLTLSLAFNFSLSSLLTNEHRDIKVLHLVALCISLTQTYLSGSTNRTDAIVDLQNAVEAMTFMPALWILCRMDRAIEVFEPVPGNLSRRRAECFFLFVASFFVFEDVVEVVMEYAEVQEPFWAAGHALHFTVLLDFGGFFLIQAYAGKSLKVEEPAGTKMDNCAGEEKKSCTT